MKGRLAIACGFIGAILAGAFLLMLPAANASGTWARPFDAAFTACSAVCITGLTVIDPGVDLTLFGQCVLLALVQLGCVGIMSVATFFLMMVGSRVSVSSEHTLAESYGVKGLKDIRGLVASVIVCMFVVEALGALALWWRFTDGVTDLAMRFADTTAWYRACFYSVMAFCNAGFSLDPGSLAVFRSDPVVLLVMSALIFTGGIGFLVVLNIASIRFWRRDLVSRGRLGLHSRVVLRYSLALLAFAFAVLLVLEWNHAFASFSGFQRYVVALFQSVTARTCGFTVVPIEGCTDATRFITAALMFVGAAPGGAGGGVKITTMVVVAATIVSICRGWDKVYLDRYTVKEDTVRQAIVVFAFHVLLVALAMTALLVTERIGGELSFESLFFEAMSAVSTTGLSSGDTTRLLSSGGRVVLMICMFLGRLGAITVVMFLSARARPRLLEYPQRQVVVG